MLVLLDRLIFDQLPSYSLSEAAPTRVLVSPPRGAAASRWSSPHSEASRTLAEWLSDPGMLRHRPAENRVLVVWQDQDRGAGDVVSFLAQQRNDFDVRISVLLTGPLNPESSLDVFSPAIGPIVSEPGVRSVFYIGNQDNEGVLIPPARRQEVVLDVLQALLEVGEDAGERFGFFPRVAGTSPLLCSFGVRFWGRRTSQDLPAVRRFAVRVLSDAVHGSGKVEKGELTALKEAPAALLNRLQALDTPGAGLSVGNVPRRYPEQFPEPPPNPFAVWVGPLSREGAQRAGHEGIDRHKVEVLAYRQVLVRRLPTLAAEVRKHGQEVFLRTRREVRDFVGRRRSLGAVAALLAAYFPSFTALRGRVRVSGRTPCEPASTPGLPECVERFVEESRTVLEAHVSALPKLRTFVMATALAVGLMAITVWLFRTGIRPRFAILPGLLGLASVAGLLLWARHVAGLARMAMEEHFDGAYQWLRSSFVRKAEWTVAATQRTVEFQVIADGEALGRRLAARFDEFFHDWQASVAEEPTTDGKGRPEDLGIDEETGEDLRVLIEEAVGQMVEEVVRDVPGAEGGRRLDAALEKLVNVVRTKGTSHPVGEQSVRHELEECARSRVAPPMLARLGDDTLQAELDKVFILPISYSDALASTLQSAASGCRVEVLRARVSGPWAWIARCNLTADQVKESLRVAEVTP